MNKIREIIKEHGKWVLTKEKEGISVAEAVIEITTLIQDEKKKAVEEYRINLTSTAKKLVGDVISE